MFPLRGFIVERRRRDRINDMIKTLAQIVPGCQKKDSTTGNIVGVSVYPPTYESDIIIALSLSLSHTLASCTCIVCVQQGYSTG